MDRFLLIYLSFFFAGDRIWAYDPQVCRSIAASYTNVQATYNGLPTYVYESDFNENINVKKCYCRGEKDCPPKGTFDMFKCTGIPMYSSLPHFHKAEHLLKGIESGLHPMKKYHEITASIEIVSKFLYLLNF